MASLTTVKILEQLVACQTVSSESNLPLIDWVRNFLADNGIDSQLVSDSIGQKANLIASIGPAVPDGLVFSGHTDVVPVEGQHWNTDPFKLTTSGSRLYGRGTSDMKGFLATVLSRVPTWKSLGVSRPIHLMFSYDEEVGCLGAPFMIEAATKALPKPAAVIVGEPTSMRIATEHKGYCTLVTRVKGRDAHSSLTHQGVSSVMLAGELIGHLSRLADELVSRSVARGKHFAPPYTTLSVNQIQGGTAVNILAALCEFRWDIRALPGEVPDTIIEELARFAGARQAELLAQGKWSSVETSILANVPPLQACGGLAEQIAVVASGSPADSISVPFATEAGQFQQAGWATVVCGPGSIDQAHKPDEFIECSELAACEDFLDRAIALHCQ